MEKRTFLAIVLSIAILISWQMVVGPKGRHPSKDAIPTDVNKSVAQSLLPQEHTSENRCHPVSPSVKPVKTFRVETNKAIYVLSEDEASVVSCSLKDDRTTSANKNRPAMIELVLGGKLLNDNGTGIWSNVQSKNQPLQISFIQTVGDFDVEKSFCFSNDSYLIDVKYTVTNKAKVSKTFDGLLIADGPGLGTDQKEMKENKRMLRAISYSQKKVEKLKVGEYPFPLKWAGIDNRYFLSVFCQTSDVFKKIKVEETEKLPYIEISTDKIDFLPSEKKLFSVISYTGTKGFTHLKGIKVDSINPQFEKAIDFGFFGDLGELALSALNYIYKITHNYGLAIFIISVFLNIIFYPLSKKSFTSAMKMKSVQEEVKVLQSKYKGDPKKMNTEVWALYKAKGVNPFGGCLPMLVQMPIFWALFTMLRNAYELRGAPFIFWITDLSAKDPYYILPILMGGGMFLQQWMSANTSDPTQKQMMIMMPVIFTIMFLGFPSGLVIYWLTNSIITILEQWLVFKRQSVGCRGQRIEDRG